MTKFIYLSFVIVLGICSFLLLLQSQTSKPEVAGVSTTAPFVTQSPTVTLEPSVTPTSTPIITIKPVYIVPTKTFAPAPVYNTYGASAKCRDGSLSYSQSRQGTCSHHGGVSVWY